MNTKKASSDHLLVRNVIAQTGAEIKGHFSFGGRHSGNWIATELFIAKPQHAANLCRMLAMQLLPFQPDVVIGLAPDGIVLAHAVGATLTTHLEGDKRKNLLAVYADEQMRFARGYGALVAGRTAVLALDIVSCGDTAQRLVDLTTRLGGTVTAVGAIIDRGSYKGKRLRGDLPLLALCDYALDDWDPEECPLCAEGVPLQNPPNTILVHG